MRHGNCVLSGVLALLLIGASPPCLAQPAAFRIRAQLVVSVTGDFKDRLTSCLHREIRSLGDVEEVETKPDYLILLNVIAPTIGTNRTKIGYAAAYAAQARFANEDWAFAVRPKYQKGWKKMTSNLYFPPLLNVEVSPDVDGLCKDVVATIDARLFEPARKLYRSLQDMSNKRK